ncbi:unnamed protein product [Durusdinium trenchii]|uniref:DEK C-terminal domain-containing protein n=2 Tax=Durusdinium trenchii TaxID=1381693 RepID=A0ABP0QVP4_9DINO
MMAMEVVVNADKYEDKLATTRKICSFLSKKLGMSKNDLCPALKSKFDEVAAIPKAAPAPEDGKAAKRPRRAEAVSQGPKGSQKRTNSSSSKASGQTDGPGAKRAKGKK